MIGAGSAMGPFPKLLAMGATVVAIDIPGGWGKGTKRPTAGLWKRLCDTAKNSPGSIVFPLTKPQSACASEEEMYESSGCIYMHMHIHMRMHVHMHTCTYAPAGTRAPAAI